MVVVDLVQSEVVGSCSRSGEPEVGGGCSRIWFSLNGKEIERERSRVKEGEREKKNIEIDKKWVKKYYLNSILVKKGILVIAYDLTEKTNVC
ncbi:hypothetical protein Hanom_Chr08g00697941 [Helianthus anomalus]